jgi:DNA polymerase-3 subunit delta'
MPLPPVYGHEALRGRLTEAIAAGRLPQALMLEGPPGVGKQRLALWIGQTLLCEHEGGLGEPCGQCRACSLATKLSHPDLHWFIPVELAQRAGGGGDPNKQVELAEEALGEELARRRERPLYRAPSGLAGHGLASVRLLLRKLVLTPVMGRYKVFILGDADRLVAQPGADQAANALLKALEEPPHDTQFVLTTADVDAILPTIRSRVVRVRVPRLQDSVITAFVHGEISDSIDGSKLRGMVASADGCPGRLLAPEGGAADDEDAGEFLKAVGGGLVARRAYALGRKPYQARGGFSDMLDDLLERLRDQVRKGGETVRLVEAIALVLDARAQARGNVNPQLLAAVLSEDLAGVL